MWAAVFFRVAGEHEYLDAHPLELFHRLPGGGFERIADGHHAQQGGFFAEEDDAPTLALPLGEGVREVFFQTGNVLTAEGLAAYPVDLAWRVARTPIPVTDSKSSRGVSSAPLFSR